MPREEHDLPKDSDNKVTKLDKSIGLLMKMVLWLHDYLFKFGYVTVDNPVGDDPIQIKTLREFFKDLNTAGLGWLAKAKAYATNAKASEVAAKASEVATEGLKADTQVIADQVVADKATVAGYVQQAGVSESNAEDSEEAAKRSEDAAKVSETNAKASETKAKASEVKAAMEVAKILARIGLLNERFFPASDTDPTGADVDVGDFYYNTSLNEILIYSKVSDEGDGEFKWIKLSPQGLLVLNNFFHRTAIRTMDSTQFRLVIKNRLEARNVNILKKAA